jgi:hypothetical protein
MSIPLALVAGISVPLLQVVSSIPNGANGPNGYMDVTQRIFTGSSPSYPGFNAGWFKWSYYPILVGAFAHWLAGKAGVNKAIARSGIPLIRI